MTTNEPRQRPETVIIMGEMHCIDWHSTFTDAVPFTNMREKGIVSMSDLKVISGWDYRVVKLKEGGYTIQEVYFDDQERIEFGTDAAPRGHDLEELAHDLAAMVEALGKPVLDEAEIEAASAAWLECTEAEIAEGKTVAWEDVRAKHWPGDS